MDAAASPATFVVIKVATDSNVPPLPPHIKPENAKSFRTTLLTGDPEEVSVINQTIKQVAADYLPGKKS